MQTTNRNRTRTLSSFCLISTIAVLFLMTPISALGQDPNSIDTLRQMGKAFAGIAGKASPAVVGIQSEKLVTRQSSIGPWGEPFDPFEDDLFDFFFRRRSPRGRSPRPKFRQTAQGSGFIISSDGHILTNNHLVEGTEEVTVKLADRPEVHAKVIGTDPGSDIAIIKIDVNDLPYLELADSDVLEVGEWVIAIGNPFGLSHTVTAGIVSAKGRSGVGLAAYEDFIQTDAAINPGNSGGPLLNLDGKVVGINTAIISRSGGNMGIGLAIPVNMVKDIYDELIEGKKIVRGFLGVYYGELTPKLAKAFGVNEDTKGVIITQIIEDSAAEDVGLKPGDIIVEFDGKAIEKADTFRKHVAKLKPGTKVKIVVLRDEKRKTFKVELGERPTPGTDLGEKSETAEQLGLAVQELTEELAGQLGYKGLSGVVITSVESGSEAARKGLRQGMLIMEVNRAPVSNVREFNEAVEQAAKVGNALLLFFNNGRINQFVVLELPKK